MRSVVASVQLLLLLAVEVAAVVALVRLGGAGWAAVGWDDPLGWLAVVDAGDAVAALGRLVALAGAGWLAGSTVLAVGARLSRVPAAIRAVDVLTLPSVRRLADRVVAVALTTTSLAAPAGAALAAPVPHVATAPAAAEDVGSPAPAGPVAAPVVWPGLPPLPAPTPSVPPPPPTGPAVAGAGAGPGVHVHVVAAGDTLWDLARARVADGVGVAPPAVADRDVHAYWVRVLDANRDRIPSHDPDLIHPGDQVLLPPLH